MKITLQSILFLFGLLISNNTFCQGAISSLVNDSQSSIENNQPTCGSYHYMEQVNNESSNYFDLSTQLMQQINALVLDQQQNRAYEDLYVIPVVFHIVYNNNQENLHDSVLLNQITILNECFRRKNADTTNTRNVFHPLVGDSKIEFKLADIDPAGNPTTGITRTSSTVSNFGGILPYGASQTQEIQDWINDSLFYNFFRITQSSLGGSDPWNTDEYLNVWIGDLRILEPQFNNLEELVFFGLSTPPSNHQNWPDSVLQITDAYHQGVLMHYVNIGANNPNSLPAPYTAYNGLVNKGKMLVHETGHYLGLRHIWADGDCTIDDHISDTPLANNPSQYNCNPSLNSCVDNINGQDLPNMTENYMDYSSSDCQNAFTIGQADVMRAVLENFRIDLPTVISTASIAESNLLEKVIIYPNPSNGNVFIDLGTNIENVQLSIFNGVGQVVLTKNYVKTKIIPLGLAIEPGVYFVQLSTENGKQWSQKIIIE
ncbi:hypothetical protein DNU06_02295 [Putridiphycobacter roseus]|uniref:Peptidase M43 pregnancy-associated plasma-A domain-containing protein n=1 Tax=Putridiphycobacter roseus TaxID=2219161 RepID=A0A2W1N217_9FLAO|nr:zinc-dependent metalloprotease [Putridiphycobacter roseus]PZE18679.1 hypothetical protein DNU06_02295 [Putridiphycobacter roseus]